MASTTLGRVPLCTAGFVVDDWGFEGSEGGCILEEA